MRATYIQGMGSLDHLLCGGSVEVSKKDEKDSASSASPRREEKKEESRLTSLNESRQRAILALSTIFWEDVVRKCSIDGSIDDVCECHDA